MSTRLPLHEFKITHSDWPVTTPSKETPIVNPLSLLLCRYPLGSYLSNPNFALLYSRKNAYDKYVDPLYSLLTSGSMAPIDRPKKKGTQTFWMKTYSENAGLLEVLESAGVLKRTGQVFQQGFVTLVAVETQLVEGQWAEVCHNQKCGKREQLETEGSRMKRCSKCRDAWYCNAECQKANWPSHKKRCKVLKEAAEKRAAVEEETV
jgi:MYND finger